MKKIKALQDKISTIGIVAPASSNEKEIINTHIENFKKLGYKIKLSKNLYNMNKYLSASDKERAEDINLMFKDNEVDAIICYRGGYGSIRMANYLDISLIRKNPKIFCGYSDITLLLNHISSEANFVTFHSPMVNSNFEDELTREFFISILENKNKLINYDISKITNNNFEVFHNKNFCGKLIGGNLSLICSTISTPYEIKFKDNILLIEEIGEKPYAIDRMLSQLIASNKIRKVSGIILGQFTDCIGNENSFTVDEIIKDKLLPLNIPIIKGFPFGHDYPNLILPIGGFFKYDSKNFKLYQCERFFK